VTLNAGAGARASAAVPEPATVVLLAGGLGGLLGFWRAWRV
jgi:hypothetical protein